MADIQVKARVESVTVPDKILGFGLAIRTVATVISPHLPNVSYTFSLAQFEIINVYPFTSLHYCVLNGAVGVRVVEPEFLYDVFRANRVLSALEHSYTLSDVVVFCEYIVVIVDFVDRHRLYLLLRVYLRSSIYS